MSESQIPTLRAWGRALVRGARSLGRGAGVVLRPVGRAVLRPPVLGAIYLLALTAAAAPGPLIDDTERALGAGSARIEQIVQVRFARTILSFAGSVTLTAIVLGAALGAIAGAAIALRRFAHDRPPLPRWLFVSLAFALTVLMHAAITLAAMAWYPQLYTDAFYAAGGFRAWLQVSVTHRLGHEVVTWICLGLAALILPPPWTFPRLARRAREAVRGARWWVALPIVAAGLIVVGMPRSAAPSSAETRPNILILAADSFREEGLNPRVMPRLSALAERGVRFSNAYVSMARTLPSWATFLSGKDAHHHGLRSMFPRYDQRHRDFDTLPRRLSGAGYRTAVVSDYGGDAFRTADLGFQRTEAPLMNARELIRSKGFARTWPLLPFLHSRIGRRVFPPMREMRDCADASMLAADAIDMLRELRGSSFMLTVFFSAPHAPYAAPAPYYKRFSSPGYAQRYKYKKSSWVASDEKVDAEQVAQIYGLYQGTLASVDDGAARVLDELERLGLRERTVVVVLGDHGENLADAPGRFYGHGNHLFGDHDLHIPFVLVDPRRSGGRVESGVVTNADLAPTLYELTGTPAPKDMDGMSLVPALGGAKVAPRPAFAESELWIGIQPDLPNELRFPYPEFTEYSDVEGDHDDMIALKSEFEHVTLVARHRMVRDGAWKLIYIPTAKGVVYKLFDTVRDPENLTDVAADHPEEVSRLKALLWAWMLKDPAMEERRGYLAPKGFRIPEIDR